MNRTGEKPFSCDECGQHFTRKATMKQHQMIHTGEKPFSCDDCGQRFNQKSNMKQHKMCHTGEKRFSCDECGKRFTKKINLRHHETTHIDERPFIGDSKFRNKSSLRSHFENHSHEDLLTNSLKTQFDVKDLFPATSKISENGNKGCNNTPTELNYQKGIHVHDLVPQFQNTEEGSMSQNDSLTNSNEMIFVKSIDQTPLDSSTVADVREPTRELRPDLSTDKEFNNLLRYKDQNICANNETDIQMLKLAPSELKDSPLNPYYEDLSQQDASLLQKNSVYEASRYWYAIHKKRLQNDSILDEDNSCRNPNRMTLETRGCEPGTSSSSSKTLYQENNVRDYHFVCSHCGERCKSRSKLYIHIRTTHGIDE